ncbi:MAG: uroporphyrinogen decarboxylase family protein [Clostridia bacterium]
MQLNTRKPNFENILKVLRREQPSRPTLFELFMNTPLYEKLAGHPLAKENDGYYGNDYMQLVVEAYKAAGYDYATCYACNFRFKPYNEMTGATISLNDDIVFKDRASYAEYQWPELADSDFSRLERIKAYLPEGMKLMVMGPGGVLENAISLVGYENLCYMLFEDPELAQIVFDNIGSRLVQYYEKALTYETVGFIMSNDDWGFNTQTFFSPKLMRKYVFPWHKKIVAAAHKQGKPAVLHSCGNLSKVMEDIIEDMQYDGKHSYEDNIMPVEEFYQIWGDRIAILGGLDLNFLVKATPEEIKARSKKLLALTQKGGYALGSGNSIPEYIPSENYLAMLEAIEE